MTLGDEKLEWWAYKAVLTQTTRVTDGQKDRQTDGIGVAYTRYSIYADARKNWQAASLVWFFDSKLDKKKPSLYMYAWLIRANVSDSEHNQSEIKHTLRHSYDPQYTLAAYTGCSYVECCFRCVCLVVCVNLGPKCAISRGEQNRYGWRRRTLLTARLIKFYGGLRRLMAAARGSISNIFKFVNRLVI